MDGAQQQIRVHSLKNNHGSWQKYSKNIASLYELRLNDTLGNYYKLYFLVRILKLYNLVVIIS